MKKKRWLLLALTFVFLATFLVSGVWLAVYFMGGSSSESRYEELSQLLPEVAHPLPPAEGETLPETSEPETVTVDGRQILPRFLQLYGMNSDLVGWLSIPGTKVDYPVMQTPDDPEYYLKRNFDKKSSSRGCLFAQWDTDVFTPSDNVILYGHNMRDGTMFGQLDKYRKQAFYEENPYIYFDTLEEAHAYEVMAVFRTSATAGEGFLFNSFVDAEDREEFDEFVAKCKKLSMYDTGVEAVYGDKLLCLCTCEYTLSNGRLIIVAKRIG